MKNTANPTQAMITQPKTKQEFEQWKRNKYNGLIRGCNMCHWVNLHNHWDALPFAFQQGVYQEYFRSVGIDATTRKTWNGEMWVFHAEVEWDVVEINTDPVYALLAALNAAAELREEQLVNNIP